MRILSHRIIDLTPQRMAARTFRPTPMNPRSAGHHEGAINRYLAQGAGMLDDDDKIELNFPRFTDTFYPLVPAMGVQWEDFWASLYGDDELIWQPAEWERDHVFGTPDGLMLDGPGDPGFEWRMSVAPSAAIEPMRIAECKGTYKSMVPIDSKKMWLYVRQGLAMCALNEYGIRQVEYHILWYIHDYRKRPYTPAYSVSLVQFEEAEVQTWWGRMLAVKDKVKPE